jgi:hypothetical protein
MHKALLGLAAAASIGLASLAAPSNANAGCYGCAVGAGVLGGVAAGAIIGSAIANNPPPTPGLLSAAPATSGLLRRCPRRLRPTRTGLLLGPPPGLGGRLRLSGPHSSDLPVIAA